MERNRRRSRPLEVATRLRPGLEALEDRRLLSAGALDPTFDGDGIVTTLIGTRAQASDLAILPDGRLVAAGHAYKVPANNAYLDIADFALARYLPTGALDPMFGGDGIVTTDFKKNVDHINAVVVQADGKVIAGGSTDLGNNADNFAFALTRYNVDGSLDAAFGGTKAKGKVVTDFSSRLAPRGGRRDARHTRHRCSHDASSGGCSHGTGCRGFHPCRRSDHATSPPSRRSA
jgi:uncharacterized delta-60 repeat protein